MKSLMLLVVSTIIEGIVLSILWAWFIVTRLHWPALGIPASIGVIIMASLLTTKVTDIMYVLENPHPTRDALFQTAAALEALVLGWIVHFFV